jgi:hypothetical protein
LMLSVSETNDAGKDGSVLCAADGYLTEAPGSKTAQAGTALIPVPGRGACRAGWVAD